MRQWDSYCDQLVENMKQYGAEARRAELNGQHDVAKEFDAKCESEQAKFNDYRGVTGPRSLAELVQQIAAYLRHLRGS